MQKTGLPYAKALARLRKAHDSMREALGEDIEPRLRGLLQGHAEGTAVTTGQSRMDMPRIDPQIKAAAPALISATPRPDRDRSRRADAPAGTTPAAAA